MSTTEVLLDQLIDNQQQSMRSYYIYAGGLILLGFSVLAATAIASNLIVVDAFKILFGMGGALVSSLSSLQIKEIVARKEKIRTYNRFKAILKAEVKDSPPTELEERKKIEDMIWRAMDKTSGASG